MPRPTTPSYPSLVTTSPPSMLTSTKSSWTLVGSQYALSFETPRATRRPFPHLPALDGLRALAVAAVLAFHAGWRFTSGGFLGVSTFFTLSGFLITARLVREHEDRGTIDLPAFWGRRIRRLIPAAVVAVALVVALAAWVVPTFRTNLIGDVTAALTEVANWRFWLAGRSYSTLFRQPSPLLHFWSLAIEEQFYLVFPLIVWLVLVKLRRGRLALTVVVATLAVAAALASLWAGITGRHTLAYYGTPMRAAEILTGALLALIPLGRPTETAPSGRAKLLPVYALVACVLLWMAATTTQPWLDRGGLPAYSLLSAIVVAGCIRPGPLRRWLSVRPLQWLGRISYGVYLYHWPLYQWLSPRRTQLSAAPLFAVRIAASLAAAVLSYYLLEQPIMHAGRRGWIRARRMVIPLVATMTAVIASAVVIGGGAKPTNAVGFRPVSLPTPTASATSATSAAPGATTAAATTDASSSSALPATSATSAPTPAASPDTAKATTEPASSGPTEPAASTASAPPATTAQVRPTAVSVFGDSTALKLALGLRNWSANNAVISVDLSGTALGCGIGRGGRVRIAQYGDGPTRPDCDNWEQRWGAALVQSPADVAIVLVSPWDVTDRQLPGDPTWRAPGDPVYDAFLKREMLAAADFLGTRVKMVEWLTSPLIDFGRADDPPPAEPYPVSDPARMHRFNELLAEVANERPNMRLVDLAGYLRAQPDGELGAHLRPDGVHFTEASATEVATWLGPELLVVAGRPGPAVPSTPTS